MYCNKLFEYERTYREKGLSYKQVTNRRQKDQKPVVEGFLARMNQLNPGSKRLPSKEYKVSYFTIEQTKWFLWALDNPIKVKRKAHDRIDDTGKPYHVPEYSQEWKLSLEWRAYFYLALFAGDRRGENIALTWDDINFETGEVNINKSTAYTGGQVI